MKDKPLNCCNQNIPVPKSLLIYFVLGVIIILPVLFLSVFFTKY